jgi:hypothetical protein
MGSQVSVSSDLPASKVESEASDIVDLKSHVHENDCR